MWERFDEAIKCYEKAIERKSLHFHAYSMLARIYALQLDKRDKAIEILQTFEDHLMKYGKQDIDSKCQNYELLSRIYNRIDEPEIAIEIEKKKFKIKPADRGDKILLTGLYIKTKQFDKVEKIFLDLLQEEGFSFDTYKRLISFYKKYAQDEAKAIRTLNKLIEELDSLPLDKKRFRDYVDLSMLCHTYKYNYDLQTRISNELDRIENYLNSLPDSSFEKYNNKTILSQGKKGHHGGMKSYILKIENPEQAELLLHSATGPILDMNFREWYYERLAQYYPRTTAGAKRLISTHLHNCPEGEAIAHAVYFLRFSSNLALDSYWLAKRVKLEDKETKMYLFKKTLEHDPAAVLAAVSVIDTYIDWKFYLDAEKTCLSFLELPSEKFSSRQFPEPEFNNSYEGETEFLSKLMIYYKLVRLYAYYWDEKESDAKAVVKKMAKYFRSGSNNDQCERSYLLMARAYRIIDKKRKANKLYKKALKLFPDYQSLIYEQREMQRYESIDLKNLKNYRNVPRSREKMKLYI